MVDAVIRVADDEPVTMSGGAVGVVVELPEDKACTGCGDPLQQENWVEGAATPVLRSLDDDTVVCGATEEGAGPHALPGGPAQWCESVTVRIDEADNSVTTTISLKSGRSFPVTIREYPEDGQLVYLVAHVGVRYEIG